MSDYNSSLPVRTEANGDVAVKVVDGTITSQALAVDSSGKVSIKLDDGSGTPITSQLNGAQQALDVGINVAGVQIDPRQVRALTSADVVTANQGAPNSAANGWPVKLTDGTNTVTVTGAGELHVFSTAQPGVDIGDVTINNTAGAGAVNIQDGGNSITVDGTITASNFPATVDTNFGTVGASTLRTAAELGNATGGADFNFGTVGAQTLRTAAELGNATGAANFNNGATGAQTLRVAANLAIGGADVTALNPVPVTMEDSPGTHINNYKDAAAVAANASDNHDYTVTALKTLYFNQVESSASGKAKMVIQVETGVASNVFTTYFTQFNSTADTNMSIQLKDDIVVAAGVRVRVIMTNKDNQAQDLYSTICGYEV